MGKAKSPMDVTMPTTAAKMAMRERDLAFNRIRPNHASVGHLTLRVVLSEGKTGRRAGEG